MKKLQLVLIALLGWIGLGINLWATYPNLQDLGILMAGFTIGFGTYWYYADKGRIDDFNKRKKR